MAPPNNNQLPKLDALIIVEGFNDCLAVHRAVRSPVFVLGGGYALAEAMKPELRFLSALAAAGLLPQQLVVFTDPDWQGRMFRTYLDDLLPPSLAQSLAARAAPRDALRPGGTQRPQLLRQDPAQAQDVRSREGLVLRHAFVRVELGISDESSRNHEAGNVGVEHASPDTIRTSLKRARPGFGITRKEFSVEELKATGLVGSWDDKAQVAGPQLRRARFCRALGIDEVGTGKALVNLLNRFFTREEFTSALEAATGHER